MQSATQAELEMPNPPAIKKKKSAGRKPGRPYRRLAHEVLSVRRDTLNKKLQVIAARRTLLEDRLCAYDQELNARNEDTKGSA
jgi:DNA invertase Pin-like site-specific DNA recombinase